VAGIVSVLMHELGREIFWCPCGLVWLDGVWLRKLVDGQAE
jgi:Zn-finger nucleic acid-binding protein